MSQLPSYGVRKKFRPGLMRQRTTSYCVIDMLQVVSIGTLSFTLFLVGACTANPAPLSFYSKYRERANLISATANQASGHGIQTSIFYGHVQGPPSIAPLQPRSVFSNSFVDSWNLIFDDWKAFPPSFTTAKAIYDMVCIFSE